MLAKRIWAISICTVVCFLLITNSDSSAFSFASVADPCTLAIMARGPQLFTSVTPSDYGYLDLDVSPEDAQIFIDGKLKGVCDQFDGVPDYLYLPAGSYLITFSREGYLSYERQITVKAGQELEFNFDLKVAPNEMAAPGKKATEIFIYNEATGKGMSDAAPTAGSSESKHPAVAGHDGAEDKPEGSDMMSEGKQSDSEQPPVAVSEPMTSPETRQNSALVKFRILPDEASIYIDKKFVGTAAVLNDKDGLPLDEGTHQFDCVMPGYRTVSETMSVAAQQTVYLRTVLEKDNQETTP